MKRLTIEEETKLGELYIEILNEMDSGDIFGNVPSHGGDIENTDFYATGDTRRPKLLGGVQTRSGLIKKKKRKKLKKI
jgi:hypothetical protein